MNASRLLVHVLQTGCKQTGSGSHIHYDKHKELDPNGTDSYSLRYDT